jgi:putative transcriptional regulator
MKVFKKKGELTRFQILAEIAKEQPHLRQKDIAYELGITIQAVSENIKSLVDDGFVETGMGNAKYRITKRGIEKVKTEALNLRKYADNVLDTMNTYKSVWPAIAREDMKAGETVWLEMENGTLYASKKKNSAYAEVLENACKGDDVALIKLGGTIKLRTGNVTIIQVPTINEGGSKACDLKKIREIYETGFDKVGIMGTVSRAVINKAAIESDFEFATPNATVAASKRGLNVLVFTVGKMSKSLIKRLDEEGLKYTLEDVSTEINPKNS